MAEAVRRKTDIWLDPEECAKLPGSAAARGEIDQLHQDAAAIAEAAGWEVFEACRANVSFLTAEGDRVLLRPSDQVFAAMLRMARSRRS